VSETEITVTSGTYIVQGIQLRNRFLIPLWLGDLILWLFFHRLDTKTTVVITR
jgi:hypothetical protein